MARLLQDWLREEEFKLLTRIKHKQMTEDNAEHLCGLSEGIWCGNLHRAVDPPEFCVVWLLVIAAHIRYVHTTV